MSQWRSGQKAAIIEQARQRGMLVQPASSLPIPASKAINHETSNRRPVPDPEPERHQAPALDRADAGEKESLPRITVRFVGYRVRPLDPDNFAGSIKDLLDGLRHAGIIPGDESWRIRLETEQERVRSFAHEKTLIEVVTAD